MSGRKFTFEINKTSTAPAATLFRLETDGADWAQVGKPIVVQSGWVRQGDPAPGGIGAVRKVGMWPVLVQEETVEYEQDRRHVYKLVGPAKPGQGLRRLRWSSRRTRPAGPTSTGAVHSSRAFRDRSGDAGRARRRGSVLCRPAGKRRPSASRVAEASVFHCGARPFIAGP